MSHTICLPVLGSIQLEKTNWEFSYEYHQEKYRFGSRIIDMDIHLKALNDQSIHEVTEALDQLEKVITVADDVVVKDFHKGGEVAQYIHEWHEHIFEQIFSPEEFTDFLSDVDADQPIEQKLLSKLRLVRLGIYAESDEFFTLDYAFGYELEKGFRDDMLVVKLDKHLNVVHIITEG